jgi:hypothetical protein
VNWLIEGDIRACFDELDHSVLVNTLRQKIHDERFLNLIWKLLNAGYMDLHGKKKESLIGSPQGGILTLHPFALSRFADVLLSPSGFPSGLAGCPRRFTLSTSCPSGAISRAPKRRTTTFGRASPQSACVLMFYWKRMSNFQELVGLHIRSLLYGFLTHCPAG